MSYLCGYLPLKQMTPLNTLFGAVVGSLPPFIGLFAQTGSLMGLECILLSAYIFSWQFPHFFGILYENKEDYKKAGFNMLSNTDPEGIKAFNQIAICTVLNSVVPLAMCSTGMLSAWFLPIFYFYQAKYIQSVVQFKNNKGDA
jgi:heme O synthase-like polyprenyltransferase